MRLVVCWKCCIAMLHSFTNGCRSTGGYAVDVLHDDAARRSWLEKRIRRRLRPLADRWRNQLLRIHGENQGRIEYVEAFEASKKPEPVDAVSSTAGTTATEAREAAACPEWPDMRVDD